MRFLNGSRKILCLIVVDYLVVFCASARILAVRSLGALPIRAARQFRRAVRAVNVATGVSAAAQSNDSGTFSFPICCPPRTP